MSASKNFVLGATTGIFGLGVKTILNIIVYPFILQKLGVEQYGLYVLLLNMVDLIILMDMGLTSGIIQRLSTFRAQEAEQDARQILSVGLILYAVLALLSFAVCFNLIPLVPVFFGFHAQIADIALFCLYIILIEGTLTLFQGYFSAVLMSHTLYQWVNTSESLYFIVANGGIFALLHMGYGLKEIALLRLGAAFLKFLLVFTHAVRVDPACIKPFYFNFKKAVELLKVSLHAMVRTVSDIFANRTDLVMIGRFMSLRDVAIFEFVFRFLNIIMQIPMHIANSIFPIFTRLKALQNTDDARLLFLRLSCFINFAVTALIAVLCFYYQEIFTFFAGGRMTFSETIPLLALAIPGIISSAVCMPASHYLFAAGRFRLITASSTSTSLLKMGLVLLSIRTFGLVGVLCSTLVMDAIYHQMLLIRETCRELSITFKEYVFQVYLINLPVLGLSCLGLYLLKTVPAFMALHMMVHTVVAALLVLPVGLFLWFVTTASDWEKGAVKRALEWLSTRAPGGRVKVALD